MDSQYNTGSKDANVELDSINLAFFYGDKEYKKVDRFYAHENVFYENLSFELKENTVVKILFSATEKNARLYMYGLESLYDKRLETDENGDVYLKPSTTLISLYEKDYYPLIPGKYVAKLIFKGETYYLPFEVQPKQVTDDQLDHMKRELEEIIRGLAIDFVKRIYSATDSTTKAIPPQLLKQFMMIKKYYPTVMAALIDIYKKAIYRTGKEYQWTHENRARKVDHVTLRTLQTKSFHEGKLKIPYNAIVYDLPENRWVKYIIRNVLVLLDQFESSLIAYECRLFSELKDMDKYTNTQESTRREKVEKEKVSLNIDDYRQLVHRMKIGFQMIINAPWYQEITNETFTHVPHNLLSDSRYRVLFQLHRELKEEEVEVFIDQTFMYQWKRTDKLYEVWGYINILKLLIELGFQPKSGWLYDKSVDKQTLLIPYLSSGECIVLTKNNMEINYSYDSKLPLVSSETSLKNSPIYMGKRNRPDGRIDFYKENIYMGSLMIDFKYRPISNFWRDELYNSMKRSSEMEQIIAYQRDSYSKYLYGEYGEKEGNWFRDRYSPRPVLEVWALYAEAREDKQQHSYIKDHKIRIIPMNPGKDYTEIRGHLQQIINFIDEYFDKILRDVIQKSQI